MERFVFVIAALTAAMSTGTGASADAALYQLMAGHMDLQAWPAGLPSESGKVLAGHSATVQVSWDLEGASWPFPWIAEAAEQGVHWQVCAPKPLRCEDS